MEELLEESGVFPGSKLRFGK
ncbi:MAG: hypothetical protein MUF24_12345 [Chitinophagaceae bacterium]|nr:hypothetical protein [Chitinophagaceae bacterium]